MAMAKKKKPAARLRKNSLYDFNPDELYKKSSKSGMRRKQPMPGLTRSTSRRSGKIYA